MDKEGKGKEFMKKLEPEDILDQKYLSQPSLASKGDYLTFCVSIAAEDKTCYEKNIFLFNTSTNSLEQITLNGKAMQHTWFNNMLYYTEKGENRMTSIVSFDPRNHERKVNYEIDKEIELLHIVTERSCIVAVEEQTKERDESNAIYHEVLDEVPFWFNGKGFTNGLRRSLYMLDLDTGYMERISPEGMQVYECCFSAEENKLFYFGKDYKEVLPLTDEVYMFDFENKENQVLLPKERLRVNHIACGKHDLILCGTDMQQYGIHENPQFYKIDINGKIKKLSNVDLDISHMIATDCAPFGGCTFACINETVYFVVTERDGTALYSMDMNGECKKITDFVGSIDSFAVNDSHLFAICLKDYKLQELYEITDFAIEQKTFINETYSKERPTYIPERFSFVNDAGIEIDGYVIKPNGYSENKKFPMILDVHGGPKGVYGEVYYYEMQLWADMGYFVIYCNPRGSAGRGIDFANIWGQYGTIDYNDIMTFVDKAVERYPNIDQEKLFVTGGSYGGFMTNWIIGHTDKFKAAASQRSISNWLSDFCMSDISFQYAEYDHQCTPWTDPDKLWFHSPIKYADKVKTPLLLIHSDLDMHCCIADALQMLTALKYHKVECRMCMFHGENHNLSTSGRPLNRIKRLEEITNWFENHQ